MEQGKEALVSVIIPTYNSERTIGRTIDSVINQTYRNIEVLVIDDGSKDNTVRILQDYIENDFRIKILIKKVNRGVADSRNIGIKNASGKYVAFLDADDVWSVDKLIKQIDFMEINKVNFSYTNYEVIDEESNQTIGFQKAPIKTSYRSMLIGNMIGCSTVIFNKKYVGVVSIPLLKKRNDMALWLRILTITKDGYLYDENLASYYKSSDSLSSGSKRNLLKYHYQVYKTSEKFGVFTSLFYTGCNIINLFYKRLFYFEKKID